MATATIEHGAAVEVPRHIEDPQAAVDALDAAIRDECERLGLEGFSTLKLSYVSRVNCSGPNGLLLQDLLNLASAAEHAGGVVSAIGAASTPGHFVVVFKLRGVQ